jgi:tetratricopeptide (TPR) repeat protein
MKNKMRLGRGHYIGHVSITLGTLLDACSGGECMYEETMSCRMSHYYLIVAMLEVKSEGVEVKTVTTGIIMVKLRSLRDHDDDPNTTGSKTQIGGPPDALDHSSNHTHADNQQGEFMLMNRRNLSHTDFTSYIPGSSSRQGDPDGLATAGIQFLQRFWRLGELADLENALASLQMALALAHDGHPNKPSIHNNLGTCQETLFGHLGELADLENAICNQQKAAELTDDNHPDKPGILNNLGNSQETRFGRLSELADLENAIFNQQKAVELTDDRHPDKPMYLNNLGNSQATRFERLGELADLENAICNQRKAVELTDDGHPDKPGLLTNLGTGQETRFRCFSELADLENAICNQQKAVELMDDGHPNKPRCLNNLGNSQETRFGHLGELADLENAICNQQKAVEITDDGHPTKPISLNNLGNSQAARFRRLGELADLENAICNHQKAVEMTDDGHPNTPIYLNSLGMIQETRFGRLGELADLEIAICNQQKAVELTDDGHPNKSTYLNNLGKSRRTRFGCLGELADLENAICHQRKAVELMDDGHPNKPRCLNNLGNSQETRFGCLGELADLENAIFNQQKAVEMTDDGHPNKPLYLNNLGSSQATRFGRLSELADLENAIFNQQKAVKLTNDGQPNKPMYLNNLGLSQETRFRRLGELADLENAIFNQRKAVELMDDGHPNTPMFLNNLGNCQKARSGRLGKLADLEIAICNQQKAVELTDDKHPNKPMYLNNLGNSQGARFRRLRELADLENAICNHQKAVELTDDRHPNKPRRLNNLGLSQEARFGHLGELADLENAILNVDMAIDLTNLGDPDRSHYLFSLGICQETRFEYLHEEFNLVAAISAFKEAALLNTAYPSAALKAAWEWANVAHRNGDLLSALDGYRTALEILPKVAWLGLDVHSHHDQLIQAKSENLGCLAVTCAIQLGCLDEAVVLLDLGRSVFWQQASSLRSDLEALREENSDLAQGLETVGRKLDAGNFTYLDSADETQNMGANSKEDVGRERRQLVSQWESLVERVRELSQFRYFLKPTPFHRLRQACLAGQVIIINTSRYGVDALIFGATGLIEHVPLPDIDLESLEEFSNKIVLERPLNPSVAQQKGYVSHSLKPILRAIWNDIIIKIFKKIHISITDTPVAPVHRIWWYPTGPLTFIPIHAAGPGGRALDVSQLVISSFVTTLGSLLQSQERNGRFANRQLKFVSISQSETPNDTPLPETIKEVDEVVKVIHSAGWPGENITSLKGSEATVDHVSLALDSCSWVHFACHGYQNSILGMKSAFSLYDGHLELSTIASKRLSAGQFAFLSACHAASGLKDLPGEAMHLAAGIQFAGFPSVIATLWTIRDEDAPKVAYETYSHLLRNGIDGYDVSDAATALNRAVLALRKDPEVTIDRWAPFIHFGI